MRMAKQPVLTFNENGIYCPAGDFYIDPWRPVDRALITHGHSDHARWGMNRYLATDIALPVMRHRLGDITADGIAYGEERQIGGAQVSFHPAGHVPGSAQIRVEVEPETTAPWPLVLAALFFFGKTHGINDNRSEPTHVFERFVQTLDHFGIGRLIGHFSEHPNPRSG